MVSYFSDGGVGFLPFQNNHCALVSAPFIDKKGINMLKNLWQRFVAFITKEDAPPPSQEEFNQTDSAIQRTRWTRFTVAVVSPLIALMLGVLIGIGFALWFKFPPIVGYAPGLALGVFLAVYVIANSYIVNDAVTAFVTTNPLISMLNLGSPLVSYGPGFHFAYWWEQRSGGNTVSLGEAAETYSIQVQGPTGVITVKYSVRLRPDITRLPEFLSGVAAIAADLGGIFSAKIMEFLSNMPVKEALLSGDAINKMLERDFKRGATQHETASAFEKRFGVIIGDATVEQILPSTEVQQTMSALTESSVIDQIVANSFGRKNAKEIATAIAKGKISAEEVNRRRTQTIALSGNLQGMELKESTINLQVTGLDKVDPALTQAIAAAAPALAAFASSRGQSKPAAKAKRGNDKGVAK